MFVWEGEECGISGGEDIKEIQCVKFVKVDKIQKNKYKCKWIVG